MSENKPIILPKTRTGILLTRLESHSTWKLLLLGLILYIGIVLLVSTLELVFHQFGYNFLHNANSAPDNFFDYLFFNFSTILTLDYGSYEPVHVGKLLSIIEAFFGVVVFGALLAIIVVKVLLPPANTIVFSRYAYYCTEPQRFLIIYVNTSNLKLSKVEISSYFKLGGDWGITPSVVAPFITRAVQTFYIDECPVSGIIKSLKSGDCLRVGISGGLGFANYSTFIEYQAEDILVINDRSKLLEFEGFWHPNFSDSKLQDMFHYHPQGVITLQQYVNLNRQSVGTD
jgi:hypothetical protein